MITFRLSSQNRNALDQLLARLGNLTPVMESIGQEMESRVANRFETRSDPNGSPWAAWAPSTAASYPANGRGQVLERYGDMLGSLNWEAGSTMVQWGFGAVASKAGDVYAIYHDHGTETMPRRGLLTADPDAGTLAADDEAAIAAILDDYLSI